MGDLARSAADTFAYLLRRLGASEKNKPDLVSSARVVAYAWALCAMVVACILVYQEASAADHLLVGTLVGGALTALGLRTKCKK